jgi:hypothetical protein
MDGGSSGESSTSRVAWYEWDGVKDEGKGSKGELRGSERRCGRWDGVRGGEKDDGDEEEGRVMSMSRGI